MDHHLQSSHTQLSSQPQRRQQARSLVFLIDTATMSRRAFDDAKPALIKLIEERIGPKDSVKLCQLETTLSHLTPFTTNKQHMRNALEGLNHYGNFRRQLVTIQNDINERIRARHPPRETNRLIDAKRKLKSDHLKTFMFNAEVMAEMVATREGVKSFFLVSGGGYIDTETNNRFSDFTARLNARDITVHALLLKEKVPRYVQDFARGNNLDLERRTAIPDGSVDVDYNTQNTIMENNFQLETGPFNAAVQTGGAFYKTHNFSRIFEGLQELETRANHFYTLWYKSNHEEQRLKLELVAKRKVGNSAMARRCNSPNPILNARANPA